MITDLMIKHRKMLAPFLVGLGIGLGLGWALGAKMVASSHERKMQEEILGLVKGAHQKSAEREESAPKFSRSESPSSLWDRWEERRKRDSSSSVPQEKN